MRTVALNRLLADGVIRWFKIDVATTATARPTNYSGHKLPNVGMFLFHSTCMCTYMKKVYPNSLNDMRSRRTCMSFFCYRTKNVFHKKYRIFPDIKILKRHIQSRDTSCNYIIRAMVSYWTTISVTTKLDVFTRFLYSLHSFNKTLLYFACVLGDGHQRLTTCEP